MSAIQETAQGNGYINLDINLDQSRPWELVHDARVPPQRSGREPSSNFSYALPEIMQVKDSFWRTQWFAISSPWRL
jgi:hypothetical protein